MEKIHLTRYKIYNDLLSNDINIIILSDLHFSSYVSNIRLYKIFDILTKIKPNYILFPGDLIDRLESIDDTNERIRIISWINKISSIAPVIISNGNHDLYRNGYINNSVVWMEGNNTDFINEINQLDNAYYLDNSSFEDQNLLITGLTLKFPYYHPNAKASLLPVPENKEELIKELKNLRKKIVDLASDKIKIFMCHSPIYLKDPSVVKYIADYDYYISGHMHNGCVPPILYELWNTSKGFIAPNKILLPDNTRNTLKYRDDKLLVNGALSTFQECSSLFKKANALFPIYMSSIEFTKDKTYDTEKIYKKSQYIG